MLILKFFIVFNFIKKKITNYKMIYENIRLIQKIVKI